MVLPYTKRDPKVPDLTRGTPNSAGIDLVNAGPLVLINPGCSVVIPCGIHIAIPKGYYGQVFIRSGHAFKRNLQAHPGVIDIDYPGEIMVKVDYPWGPERMPQLIDAGERFAQLLLLPCLLAEPLEVEVIDRTDRVHTGFGSTGT